MKFHTPHWMRSEAVRGPGLGFGLFNFALSYLLRSSCRDSVNELKC